MYVAPGDTYEAVVDWGATGATIGMRVTDNAGATTVARVTGFTEYPAGSGVYYRAGNTAPTDEGQYSLVFDDDGGTAAVGHVAVDELNVTTSIVVPDEPSGSIYATVDELARLLKLNNPTAAQTAAMQRVLLMATGEIDSEVDRSVDDDDLAGWQLSLVAEVCLERAVELWRAAPFGIVGIDSDIGGVHTSKNTWERYAHMLAPLKSQWGFA